MSQAQVKVVPIPSLRVHAPHPNPRAGRERGAGQEHSLEGRGQKPGVPWPCPAPLGRQLPMSCLQPQLQAGEGLTLS